MELDAAAVGVQLEDLTPNTAYVIRLYAVTDVEKSKFFVELTLRTSETSKHMKAEVHIFLTIERKKNVCCGT